MTRVILSVVFIFTSSLLFAQTDSLNYFLQKGLEQKQKGQSYGKPQKF